MSSSSSSSSSPGSPSPASLLTPDAYLARLGGGPTSAEREIRDTAHRLYLYVLMAANRRPDNLARIDCFRRLVRLCLAHRHLLLGPVDNAIRRASSSSAAASPQLANMNLCGVCSRSASLSSSSSSAKATCCWSRPNPRAQQFLLMLVSLCDHRANMFGDNVDLEELQTYFKWQVVNMETK